MSRREIQQEQKTNTNVKKEAFLSFCVCLSFLRAYCRINNHYFSYHYYNYHYLQLTLKRNETNEIPFF